MVPGIETSRLQAVDPIQSGTYAFLLYENSGRRGGDGDILEYVEMRRVERPSRRNVLAHWRLFEQHYDHHSIGRDGRR
jgi:hypothetical protein